VCEGTVERGQQRNHDCTKNLVNKIKMLTAKDKASQQTIQVLCDEIAKLSSLDEVVTKNCKTTT